MAAECPACSIMSGKTIYYQKCFDCGAVFCPKCQGQDRGPYVCAKCDSKNVRTFPGTEADLLDLDQA